MIHVRSAHITPKVVRVATPRETWLLFRHGVITKDLEADLGALLRDVRIHRTAS